MSKDLHNITLDKIPTPRNAIACQDLLRVSVSRHGWLRRKRPFHNLPRNNILNPLNNLLSMINWDRKYVVLSDGCMYVFSSELDKSPERALSLFGYTQILRAVEVRSGKDGKWAFKLSYVLDDNARVHYFSALSEDDMLGWMRAIKRELYEANGLKYSDDCVGDEDYNDLETPISSFSYFRKMKDIEKLKSEIGEDSDLEDSYEYIETENAGRRSSDSETSSKLLSSCANRKLPPIPSARQKEEDTPYLERPSPKPLPTMTTSETKSPPSQPRPMPKPPNSSFSLQQKLPKQLPPFPHFSDLPPKLQEPNKNATENIPSNKAMPAVPQKKQLFSPKTLSNTPTAFVIPSVRQPVLPKQLQRQSKLDLESLALWSGDQGEGQRYLVSLAIDGVYMIRPSTEISSQSMTLLVMAEDQLRKYKILKNEEDLFSLQTSFAAVFDSIHNLLNHYTNNNLPTRKTRLSQPYSITSNEQT